MKKIATVVCARCEKNKKLFGIRTEQTGGRWQFTWAFPLKEDVAQREHYGETDVGSPDIGDGYPGCPHCGTGGFVQCGSCKGIACYGGAAESVCPWCGRKGKVGRGEWDAVSGGGY